MGSTRQTPYIGFSFRTETTFFNWHNAYFRVVFTFQATANGANVDADTASTPVNGSFSLLQKFEITSNGVSFYDASGIHKVIFITKLLEVFNDYARSSAKDWYWYLDASNDSDTVGGKANAGATARGALSHVGATVKTLIPLNNSCHPRSLNSFLAFRMMQRWSAKTTTQRDGLLLGVLSCGFPACSLNAKANDSWTKPTSSQSHRPISKRHCTWAKHWGTPRVFRD